MLSSLINPIFAFHPAPWQKSASDCFKHLRSLVSSVEFEEINTPAQCLYGTEADLEHILPKDQRSMSRRMAVISLIKSVSNKAQASVHTCHQTSVYADMLQREKSRSSPNDRKSFLYHHLKTRMERRPVKQLPFPNEK
ncbi:hypothetical protein BBC0244_017120 [Bartonella apihabitans]|nr:hypothetical protein BBC0244_017120 [Bartonella apihabitans]